ncbi:hypothetical protein [Endozoicomonas elysicola]|uniref:Uncharacterized protein n=1 Tax=Endozoicomonas elysicola TaxID=305900 RepID=A0A081K8T1_9GAMM|nr:hypothetical protein [Endozoicomonas elysicola]KEI70557.1 hypothetical protein GV64_07235 [Endozoicomonas elysicola]
MSKEKPPKIAMVVGATGATGQVLMKYLLECDRYSKVIVLHYRTTPWLDHPKVREIVLSLGQLKELETSSTVDALFCCLGTTIKKAGSKYEFARVDRDYVLALGQWAANHGQPSFHLISAYGADGGSMAFYMKVKGETEHGLKQMGLRSLSIYQPSLLHGERDEFRLMESVGYYVMSLLGSLPVSGLKVLRPTRIEALAKLMYQQSLLDVSGLQVLRPSDIAACE